METTEAAKELLAKEGFDPVYGARPLRRAIQRMVEDPLAEEFIRGNFEEGDVVVVDFEDDGAPETTPPTPKKLIFRKKSGAEEKEPVGKA